MKTSFFILFVAAFFSACNTPAPPAVVDLTKAQQAILDADKDFCATETKEGIGKAMDKFYDSAVVTMTPNAAMTIGKAAAIKSVTDHGMDTMNTLIWAADKAVVAASGDLGYVYGHYHFAGKTKEGNDSTWYGSYSTTYKKEADGSWKAVLDINDDGPKP